MRTLGVTGGIGSGKSTVCELFRQLGARIFFADVEAKRLMVDNSEVRRKIRQQFGSESYTLDGKLNRKFLAERVFGDEQALDRLNGIVHPEVFKAFEREKERAAKEGVSLLVKEAALIFESGADRFLDAVVVVDAPLEVRVKRVMERDNVSKADVLARMKQQLPSEVLRRRADFVIDNSGHQEELKDRVAEIYEAFVARPDPKGALGVKENDR